MKDSKYDLLWKQANELLRKETKDKSDKFNDAMGVLQELNTYRIELDMQNDELQKTQRELEESKNKYVQLYDFAPIAYLTINKDNMIVEANLTSMKLFGMSKSHLKGAAFSKHIVRESQDTFYLHKNLVFKTMKKQTCELELQKADGTKFDALLQSIAVTEKNGKSESIHVVITDVTDIKKKK